VALSAANFPIKSIVFVGERPYFDEAHARQALMPLVETGFFRLDIAAVKQQLLSLPFVRETSVKRSWPATLVITIVPHTPLAIWQQKGIISQTGDLFYPVQMSVNDFVALPRLSGPKDKARQVWAHYLALSDLLAPTTLTISELSLSARGAWQMRLSNGLVVRLGSEEVISRCQLFVRCYQKQLQHQAAKLATVDCRYTMGSAVRFKS